MARKNSSSTKLDYKINPNCIDNATEYIALKNLSKSFGKLIKIDRFSLEKNIKFLNQKKQKIKLHYLRRNFIKQYKKKYDWDEIYKLYLNTYKLY